jgi:hypothetical protein
MLMYNIRFRWAVCQLDALQKCRSVYELQKALASLPKTLDETYCTLEYCATLLKMIAQML